MLRCVLVAALLGAALAAAPLPPPGMPVTGAGVRQAVVGFLEGLLADNNAVTDKCLSGLLTPMKDAKAGLHDIEEGVDNFNLTDIVQGIELLSQATKDIPQIMVKCEAAEKQIEAIHEALKSMHSLKAAIAHIGANARNTTAELLFEYDLATLFLARKDFKGFGNQMGRALHRLMVGWVPGGIPINPCKAKITSMLATEPAEFMRLSLASGKSLPFDAGKYVMCMDSANRRYFLVSMKGILGSLSHTNSSQVIPMKIGLCVPDVCDHAGMVDLLNSSTVQHYIPQLNPLLGVQVSGIEVTSPQLDLVQEDYGGIVAAAFVGFLAFLVILSTFFVVSKKARAVELPTHQQRPTEQRPAGEQLLQAPQEEAPRQRRSPLTGIVEALSLFGGSGTLDKLVDLPAYKPTDCLNGLRVLSMAWIILGHTFLMPTGISGYSNYENVVKNPLNSDVAENTYGFSLILSAQSGVDTFFFLSGFLLSYLTLKELRGGKVKLWAAIVLRYVRLTPSLAFVMLLFYKVLYFFGSGPFGPTFQDSISRRCAGSWWSELTYTMNFVPFDSDDVCLGWSWYLGDDMIFFILSICILAIYHKRKWVGWVCVIVLTGMSFGVTAWLIIKYNLSVYVFDSHYTRYSYYAYSKPYTRIPAYFVGLVAAWVLDELEQRGITRETAPKTRFAKISATVTAMLATAVLLFLTFIPTSDFGDHKNSWSIFTSVMYLDFSRPLWAMCWAVLTLLCYYDYLPHVNGFLSHRYWTPFARLTYGAYLVHPLVIKLAAGTSLQFYTFSPMDILYRFVGNVFLAFSGSAVIWSLIERPCMTLFAPPRKNRAKTASQSQSASGPQRSLDMPRNTSEQSRQGSVSQTPGSSVPSTRNNSGADVMSSKPNGQIIQGA